MPPVRDYLAYLAARGCSPHTVKAYAYDLRHLFTFLHTEALDWTALTPARAVAFLLHLRTTPARGRHPAGTAQAADSRLAPASVNRALACVSSFYDWALLAGCTSGTNPIVKVEARAVLRSVDRHRPFLQGIASGAPLRQALAVKMVRRVPRPLSDEQVATIVTLLRCRR
ncbi:site-specific integrase, partial [Pseudomonas sp. RA_35y_Pfl2_P32]